MVRKEQLALNNENLIKEGTTLRYTYDHYQRKILISKEVMRTKHKVKSPNLFDSLIMATSLIDAVHIEQENQYYSQPQQYVEDNLFKTAGVI